MIGGTRAQTMMLPLPWLALWLFCTAALLALRLFWRRRFLALPADQAAREWRDWRRRAVAAAAGTGVMRASGVTMAFRADDVISQMYCARGNAGVAVRAPGVRLATRG